MIFHDLRDIFVHVERTGGVSLRKALLRNERNFERPDTSTKHLTSAEMKEKVGDLWDKYFTFSIVRNPWDRLVSWYHACHQHPEWNSEIAKYMRNKTFTEIIKNPHPQMLITQSEKTRGVNFIGRFEKYEDSVAFIHMCLKLNYLENQIYIIHNHSEHEHYRNYYTPSMIQTVSKWYKEDIERFNYEF